jgi:hypothetical protein
METRVWIDDPNPIFRMGLACCLRRPGFVLAGESADFLPPPDLAQVDILVFDLGEQTLGWALGRAGRRSSTRLLGLVGGGGPERDLARGLCTVLARSELTPTVFVDSLRSLALLCPPVPESSTTANPPGGRVAGLVERLSGTIRRGTK